MKLEVKKEYQSVPCEHSEEVNCGCNNTLKEYIEVPDEFFDEIVRRT